MTNKAKATALARKLTDLFYYLQPGRNNGLKWSNTQNGALLAAKEMMKWYKKGFEVTQPDHTYKDTDEYIILKELPKEIKAYMVGFIG